ncbi:MAG TPA: ATP-binding protein [Candidatus Acidoferrales bacterium]|nr:ATP-binding protein [Candidatus Acidoferrales bacterium]
MASGQRRSANSPAAQSFDVCEWLREAAACLVDSTRALPAPPHPDFQPTYEAVLNARQQIEQSQRELIESIQIQSLHMVGSMLAHDLHNLSLRLGLLSQNLERFYGDPAFLESAKRVLDDTVERMQALVDNFRVRQETVVIKLPTDVNDVLRTLSQQMELDRMPGIRFDTAYGARTRIWADPFFLANAFRAVIQNAVEAMPDGGRLRIASLDGPSPNSGVIVEVEDTGMGMTRDYIERELFVPFRSGKGRGLGLGMYVCQQIMQLHEGTVHVESDPGRGTCFRLVFPQGADQG